MMKQFDAETPMLSEPLFLEWNVYLDGRINPLLRTTT